MKVTLIKKISIRLVKAENIILELQRILDKAYADSPALDRDVKPAKKPKKAKAKKKKA